MRYGVSLSGTMAALTACTVASPTVGGAVTPAGLGHRCPTGGAPAFVAAVPTSMVASATDNERSPTPPALPPASGLLLEMCGADRGLPPRVAGRAARDRRDLCRIPASLLTAAVGTVFRCAPADASSSRLGSFYWLGRSAATGWTAAATAVSRTEAPGENQSQAVASTEGGNQIQGAAARPLLPLPPHVAGSSGTRSNHTTSAIVAEITRRHQRSRTRQPRT